VHIGGSFPQCSTDGKFVRALLNTNVRVCMVVRFRSCCERTSMLFVLLTVLYSYWLSASTTAKRDHDTSTSNIAREDTFLYLGSACQTLLTSENNEPVKISTRFGSTPSFFGETMVAAEKKS
jgi:hypothetical protein